MSPFTAKTEQALARAARLTSQGSERLTTTAHLLAALLEDEDSIAAEVLRGLSVQLPLVREAALQRLSRPSEEGGHGEYSLAAGRAIRRAGETSSAMGASYAGTEHLLLSLADEPSSMATQVLAEFSVSRDRILELLQQWSESEARKDAELKELARAHADTPSIDGLCQMCRIRHQTVHLTLVEGSAMRELHLCDECARERGGIAGLV